ncbi:MAG TPA: hypothetical protein VF026_33395 [Ktedonobacteraceae bacterium]
MKKERLSRWTMAPGEEEILHRLLQKEFNALWLSSNSDRIDHDRPV